LTVKHIGVELAFPLESATKLNLIPVPCSVLLAA
jgi:hypothetical protein